MSHSIQFSPSSHDVDWMKQALCLASLGQGYVEPNPMVGCVLVAGSQVIGQGFHAAFGQAHAERAAIADAHTLGNSDKLLGSTAYVTLEPCCHHGKTPPCTEALIEARIARVVVAMRDPFPKVAGRGIQQLVDAGLQVDVGIEEHRAQQLNAPYLKRLTTGRPWVIGKWAMSLDGKIATRTGHSQWISNELSRQKVHELRARVDAILVGSGTALADDPLLSARTPSEPPRRSLRVVLDSQLQIREDSQLVRTADQFPTLIYSSCKSDSEKAARLTRAGCEVIQSQAEEHASRLDELLRYLVSAHSATNVLVEGGGVLLGSLLDSRQIDQCEVFIAPKLFGGQAAAAPIAGLGVAEVDGGPRHETFELTQLGDNAHITCRLNWRA